MSIESCMILIQKMYCQSHVMFASVEKLFAPKSFESLPLSVTAYFQFAKSFPQQQSTSMPLKHLDKEGSVWLQRVEVGCLSVFFLTWADHPEGSQGRRTGDGRVALASRVLLFFHIPKRRTGYSGTTFSLPTPGDLQTLSPTHTHSSLATPGDTQHLKDAAACGNTIPALVAQEQ